MANIKPYTDEIANAVYGEEVRSSIIGALKKVNDDNDSYAALKAEVKTMHDTVVADTATVESAVSSIGTSVEDCQGYAESAAASITTVQGYRNESETFRNQAEQYAKEAEAAAHVDIATTSKAGIVKPDGTTITVDADGTIHSTATGGTSDYSALTNKPSINGVELSGNKTTSDLSISYNDLTNKPTIPSEITIDSALSSTSENPVQNKVVKSAIDSIPKITVDSALSSTSTNPVQNKVVKAALSSIGGMSIDLIASTTITGEMSGPITIDSTAYKAFLIIGTAGYRVDRLTYTCTTSAIIPSAMLASTQVRIPCGCNSAFDNSSAIVTETFYSCHKLSSTVATIGGIFKDSTWLSATGTIYGIK